MWNFAEWVLFKMCSFAVVACVRFGEVFGFLWHCFWDPSLLCPALRLFPRWAARSCVTAAGGAPGSCERRAPGAGSRGTFPWAACSPAVRYTCTRRSQVHTERPCALSASLGNGNLSPQRAYPFASSWKRCPSVPRFLLLPKFILVRYFNFCPSGGYEIASRCDSHVHSPVYQGHRASPPVTSHRGSCPLKCLSMSVDCFASRLLVFLS